MDSLAKMLKDACEEMGDECDFRNDYSGRGMYGRKCVGITGTWSDCQKVIAAVIGNMTQELFGAAIDASDGETNAAYNLNDTVQQHIDTLMGFTYDSMGYDVILYWERIKPLTNDELSEDDGLPTDNELDEMSEQELLQWVAARNEHLSADDEINVENWAGVRETAKLIRDRIREDQE